MELRSPAALALTILVGAGSLLPGPDLFTERRARLIELGRESEHRSEMIAGGLAWLLAHQDEDGRWDADGFERHDPPDQPSGGAGARESDGGTTALALVALMGAGEEPGRGVRGLAVQRGLGWLAAQRANPDLPCTPGGMIDCALTTAALCEGAAADRELEPAAARALEHLRGHLSGAENIDPLVAVWCGEALVAARFAGLGVEEGELEVLLSRCGVADQVSDPPRVAALLALRSRAGSPADRDALLQGAAALAAPEWSSHGSWSLDRLTWGAAACRRAGARTWQGWSEPWESVLWRTRRRARSAAGSWDPERFDDGQAGRVWVTAHLVLAALTGVREAPPAPPAPTPTSAGGEVIGIGGGAGGKFGRRLRVSRDLGPVARDLERRLDGALDYLAGAQSEDGSWSDGGAASDAVETTALALLAFLGSGETTLAGPHSEQVAAGIHWLRADQDPESGRLGSARGSRAQALGTLALVETWHASRSPALEPCARGAVTQLLSSQLPDGAFADRGDTADPRATAWAVQALAAAEDAELDSFAQSLERAAAWIDAQPVDRDPAPLLFSRILLASRGYAPTNAGLHALLTDRIAAATPASLEDWNWSSYALFQVGGPRWKEWQQGLATFLTDGWDEEGVHNGARATDRDRNRTSALAALCLEVWFRYPRFRD